MDFTGIIIEESLENPSILGEVDIVETKVVPVGPGHNTPWVLEWTLHTVVFPAERADWIAEEISKSIDTQHPKWYADFKNDTHHYIVYLLKVFKVERGSGHSYEEAKKYGRRLGIPEEQLDFS